MQEGEELRRNEEELVQETTRKSEEVMQATIEESEKKLEDLRIESRILEEGYEQEHKEREMRLKQENEKVLALVVEKNRGKHEKMRREYACAKQQLRMQNEENLALLLGDNEAQIAALQACKRKEMREGRRRKRRLEAANTENQTSAPECPVCALKFFILQEWLSFDICRSALMIWDLPPGSSNVAMDTTSAEPACKCPSSDKCNIKYFNSGQIWSSWSAPSAERESWEGQSTWKTF